MYNLGKIAARSEPALRAQRISSDGPGTILHEIETLIDFIGESGLPTGSKQGNLPAAAVVANAAVEADQRAGGEGGFFALYSTPEGAGFGFLQPAFGVHFPDWRHVFAAPRTAFRAGCHVFKATMTDHRAAGAVWRRLAVPATDTLDELAYAILGAFAFDDSEHLYEFRYVDQLGKGRVYYHPYTDEGPYASEIAVGDTGLPVRGMMKFMFDYGDSWRFTLRLERIGPPVGKKATIEVLEAAGEAPEQYPSAE